MWYERGLQLGFFIVALFLANTFMTDRVPHYITHLGFRKGKQLSGENVTISTATAARKNWGVIQIGALIYIYKKK